MFMADGGVTPHGQWLSMVRAHPGKSFTKWGLEMTEDEWDMLKVQQLQKEHQRTKDVQQLLIRIEPLKPRKATGERIKVRAAYYDGKLRGCGVRTAITWKVARAVEEGRVSEDAISTIFPKLELAYNKGAYWVSCVKGAFKSVGLSWFDEEWEDA